MLFLSWQKWPDILIDFGREVYVPWQLSEGSVLYKDIAFYYGPFSPYFNAFLFKIFGVKILTLAVFNIILIIFMTFLIYRIFLYTTDIIVSSAVSIIFICTFAFSQHTALSNFNFVTPYSHGLTHGLVLSFSCIYFFILYLKNKKSLFLILYGVCLGLSFHAKYEVFFAISIATVSGMFAWFFIKKDEPKAIIRHIFTLFGISSLTIMLIIIFLSIKMPFTQAFSSALIQYRAVFSSPLRSNIFIRNMIGLDNISGNILKMIKILFYYLVMICGVFLVSHLYSMAKNRRLRTLLSCMFIFLIFILFILLRKDICLDFARPFPLLLFCYIVWIFVSILRKREESRETEKRLVLFIFAIFSFALLVRIILNVHIYHYGFALAMPATLTVVMLFSFEIPKFFINKKNLRFSLSRTYFLYIIFLIIGFYTVYPRGWYALKDFSVGKGGDRIATFSTVGLKQGIYVQSILEKLEDLTGPDDTLVVVPEGIMINYLSRRKNPTPYVAFTPPELILFDEERIFDSLKDKNPDFIIIVDRKTEEFGYVYFGTDYGTKIYSWIKANYSEIYREGCEPLQGKCFGIVIAKKKNDGI